MKRKVHVREGPGALELLEEAVHLLRRAPAGTLLAYYLGALPFVLAALFFWSDLSRDSAAADRLLPASLGLALLFVWMKTWQTVFARCLRAQLAGEPMPRWNFSRLLRVALTQTVLQFTGLILLPLAAVILLPFGWLYSFYQSATVMGDGETPGLRLAFTAAWRQCKLWQLQNHYVLATTKLFGWFVFANLIMATLGVPQLLKMFFGIETFFTQSMSSAVNTTFLAAMIGLTWLCLDPLLKAVYVLRCFYGASLQSGEDLRADLRRFRAPVPAAALLVLGLGLFAADFSRAATAPPAAPTGVAPPELNQSIEKTIRQREFTWRAPREKIVKPKPEDKQDGWYDQQVKKFKQAVSNLIQSIDDFLKKIFGQRGAGSARSGGAGWMTPVHALLYVLIAVVMGALVLLLIRVWRRRQAPPAAVSSEAIAPVPDLTQDDVAADQLPDDEWLRLARQLLERGELRLALRAFYLSSLAHLARRELILLAKFKSNRDYERELGRRGHALPELHATFRQNITTFDRVWYGRHETTREQLEDFALNVERIRAC
ncbi:MAG: DUF4129 domain-containing protein [Pedosphaera sp.]|nr:DUF4129 domain-containing protein [Pedosphaera sp.]